MAATRRRRDDKEHQREEDCDESKGPPQHLPAEAKELRLDMTAVEKAERQPPDDYEILERELARECLVIFELPDGSEGEKHFKMGHTVQVLKSFVEAEYQIPIADQQLFLDKEVMLDPLTLGDYPAIRPADTVFVRVHGDLPLSAAKK